MVTLLQIVSLILPWWLRRWLLCSLLGYDIAPTARIGVSILAVKQLKLGDHAKVGHLNWVRRLDFLKIGAYGSLGNRNWVSAIERGPGVVPASPNRVLALEIGTHGAVTNQHLLDCSDKVTVGDFAIVAGWRSQIITHSIDFARSAQTTAPVTIGPYSFVGTGSVVLKGSVLPAYSVLAAGSTLTKEHSETHTLYGGVPARPIKSLDAGMKFFSRAEGFVR